MEVSLRIKTVMKKVTAIISWSGENYCAHAEIDGVVIDTNKSLDRLKKSFLETLDFHLDDKADEYDVDFMITGSALLKLNEERIKRSTISRYTGINERQLGHYIQGKSQPRPKTDLKIREGFKKIAEDLLEYV